jgi:TonB family protein
MDARGITGNVIVQFLVNKSGEVLNPVVLHSSLPAFEEPAISVVRHWKFKPAIKDGKPGYAVMDQEFQFVPPEGANPKFHYQVTPSANAPSGASPPTMLTFHPVVYPYELERAEVTGKASARMLLSDTGSVLRVRIVSCSRPEFGLALAAAVQGFMYSPAKKGGRPVPSIMVVDQVFDAEHLFMPETRHLLSLDRRKGAVPPVSGLDAPPRPLSIGRPFYPSALVGTGIIGDATVEFMIQEGGWVRLPRIVQASRPEFGYAAVEEVASWAFEPPIFHGKPTVARARVSFKFKPKPSEAIGH